MSRGRIIPSVALAILIVAGPVTALLLADHPRKPATSTPADKPSPKRNSGKSTAAQNGKALGVKNSRKNGTKSADSQTEPVSQVREAAALLFAHEHHPELATLLESLRQADVRNFQAGLRGLTRDAERLAKLEERSDERFPDSLELWKLGSRLRLEVARLSMSPGEEFEPRLRPLMEQQQAARIRLLRLERKRLAERIARTDEELKKLKGGPDKLIALEIERLQKLVAFKARGKGTRPSSAKGSTKTTAPASKSRSETADAKTPKRKTTRSKTTPTTSVD
jgi:hypothetical protein